MKKVTLIITGLVVMAFASNLFAQEGKALKNGFSLNFELGFPSTFYGVEDDGEEPDIKPGTLFGGQIGNRWYFTAENNMGIGLMVNWIDFTMAAKTTNVGGVDFGRATMDISFIELGPVFTYALDADMALDGYYNLRPTVLSTAIVDSDGNGLGAAGFGLTHGLGAAFRYKVFNVGIEYVLGSVTGALAEVGTTELTAEGDAKMKANNFRILLGFKF